ncbi:hypothetical protein KY290_035748 [Solanum tuberosum]|uniref:Uncharacterized protein n=1 Tax=Solanum tuberosum TaxID=4113 RepID=A0ABQ7TSN4_SOLTU|nr:hypothetical protein KY290_035748 [Solanum tuberosum]
MSLERVNRHQRRPSQSFNFVLPENISLADPVAADSDNGGGAGEQNKVVPPPPANSKSGLGRTASGVSLPPLPAEKEATSRRQG